MDLKEHQSENHHFLGTASKIHVLVPVADMTAGLLRHAQAIGKLCLTHFASSYGWHANKWLNHA